MFLQTLCNLCDKWSVGTCSRKEVELVDVVKKSLRICVCGWVCVCGLVCMCMSEYNLVVPRDCVTDSLKYILLPP